MKGFLLILKTLILGVTSFFYLYIDTIYRENWFEFGDYRGIVLFKIFAVLIMGLLMMSIINSFSFRGKIILGILILLINIILFSSVFINTGDRILGDVYFVFARYYEMFHISLLFVGLTFGDLLSRKRQ